MGKTSRRKGVAFQSRVARWLREKLDLGNYQSTQGMETARGNVGDVRLQRKDGLPLDIGFLVQAKKGKRPSPWKAMQEAEEASGGGKTIPVAVVHRDAKKPGEEAEQLVIMRPGGFAELATNHAKNSNPAFDPGTDTDL